MPIPTFEKDPDAIEDFTVDWSDFLVSDTIASSSWQLPPGITNESDTNTSTQATIWLSGGMAGQYYILTNHIISATGREENQSICIKGKEK